MSFSMNWQIDLKKDESQLFLNPRLESSEIETLTELFKTYNHYPGHIWIASSGSSQQFSNSKKLYALSKQALLASAKAANEHLLVQSHDIWLNVLPRFHVGGLGIYARAHLTSSRVIDTSETSWSPLEFVQNCEKHSVTLSSLVPTQVFDLVTMELRAPPSVRAVVVGGAVLSSDLYRKARTLGWRLLPSFGMTEFCSQIATAELASLAQTEFPTALKILNHVTVSLNSQGFLIVDGPSKFTGYAQKVSGESRWTPAPEGPFLTSDKAELFDSFLIPKGRGEDFVKVKGEGVSLPWLRERLFEIHSHENLTILAVPDLRDGARLAIAGEDNLQSLKASAMRFNQEATPYERVSWIVRVEKLPRTDLGKLRWEDLTKIVSEQIESGSALPL